ncbi:hypothetical protein QF000_006223 [Paraburkholderia atlantica]|uniref:Uncharacterized protein n=1 Tax=Paraburkholderia atlantica TaxID=2654982 RepID=A0A7W8UYF6_PARAM|nr:hypothetical protein [Paraburkholderia atlantica]MBB5426461.1 hypothetical protein [Paraburkholderia atlantica]
MRKVITYGNTCRKGSKVVLFLGLFLLSFVFVRPNGIRIFGRYPCYI